MYDSGEPLYTNPFCSSVHSGHLAGNHGYLGSELADKLQSNIRLQVITFHCSSYFWEAGEQWGVGGGGGGNTSTKVEVASGHDLSS